MFERGGALDQGKALRDFFGGGQRISVQEVECCEVLVADAEMIEGISECAGDRSPRLDDLPYEFYESMPDLFGHLLHLYLADVYTNWQQNGKTPRFARRG